MPCEPRLISSIGHLWLLYAMLITMLNDATWNSTFMAQEQTTGSMKLFRHGLILIPSPSRILRPWRRSYLVIVRGRA